MLTNITKNFEKFKAGYKHKATIDLNSKKNMDIYAGEVANADYLPKYSAKEHEADYKDRLNRAANSFQNYPQKIIDIYRNSIFRTPISREGKSEVAKDFLVNVNGSGMTIDEFIHDQLFLLSEIHGGVCVAVDKPKIPEKLKDKVLTIADQQDNSIFPYAYIYQWKEITNFQLNRNGKLLWIMFQENFINDEGVEGTRFRYWDEQQWAVLDDKGNKTDDGVHGLGVTPVYLHYQRRNPKYGFITPTTALDTVFRLTLKIFQYQSDFEQMIINHVFLKLVMPKSMWDAIKAEGMGNANVLVYPDDMDKDKAAYYLQSEYTELEEMKDLIFTTLPDKILYFATLRDKVSMPREESGTAKFIDSSDEITNLLEKANSMEKAENAIVKLVKKWEGDDKDFKITYNKSFDIKSINEQLEELVKFMEHDMGSETFNKQLVTRVMFNVLGEVPEETKKQIEDEIKEGLDPALSIENIDILMNKGILNLIKLYKRFNNSKEDKKLNDEQIMEKMATNLKAITGPSVGEKPFGNDE